MSTSLPTEMTIRNFLSKELEKRAIKVQTEWSYSTPIGRLVPDLRLLNGAEYVVETKLGAESKLLDAMFQLYNYSKYTDAKGAFAVLFPEELRRPWTIEMLEKIAGDPKLKYIVAATFKDHRPSSRYVGNLSEISEWIASQVLRPLIVEVDTGFAIKVLTEAVEAITLSAKRLESKDIEEIFGGKTVFENILQYEAGHYPLDEMRQAATYLLVNQIIFYHILSTASKEFEEINEDKIRKPVDLLRYFDLVLKTDYTSVFGFDVVSKLPESATDIIKRVIMVIKALAPEKIEHDVLGKVFHELIPFKIRKAVAAFYTNNEAAEILASLAIEKPGAKVMDLACGSGTLLVASYRRKKELLHFAGKEFSLENHRKFLEHDLTGVDIMPFAAHLAVMHLSLQALLCETEKVRIAVWDSTELKPNMSIPAIYSELKAAYKKPTLDMFGENKLAIPEDAHIKKGAITLEGIGAEEIPLEKVDLVIMNPPFTRQERLPKDYKISLQNRLRDYGDKLNGRLGLHGYFVLLADRFVKQNGKVAYVLPATTLRITSTKGVRELLLDYELEHIVTTYQKAAFSEGAQFREILLLAKKTKTKQESSCLFTFIKKLPNTLNEAKVLASKLGELKNKINEQEVYISENLSAKKVGQNKLRENSDNLFRYIACEDLRLVNMWETIEERGKGKLVPFSSALKNLHGRIVEGARARVNVLRSPIGSAFIVCDAERAAKKNDLWVVKDKNEVTITTENLIDHGLVQIPKKSLVFGLRRFSGISSIDLSNKLDYIVVDKFPSIETFFQSRDIKKILSDLPKWKKYVSHRMAKLLIADRFDMSASGTKLLAWYTSMPMAGYSLVLNVTGLKDEDAKMFTIWFNSTINVLQIFLGRIETRGAWMAFRQYVMSSFFVLNPSSLTKSQKQKILKTFEDIKDAEFPSLLKQLRLSHPVRQRIDKLILEIIGFEKTEIEEILHLLYPVLANEIEKLKTLMEG